MTSPWPTRPQALAPMAGPDAIADEVATSRLAVAAGRDAIVGANAPDTAFGRPSPGGTGHFPKSIGTTNTTGSSQYFTREDHIHPRNRAKGLIRGRS